MERVLRTALKRTDRASVLRLALDGLGVFCACTLFWEHYYTIQLSEGASMYPVFNAVGDYLLISRKYNYGKGIEVGDLVRFYHPSFAGMHAAKRVLGMPGDFVCKDSPYTGSVGETGEMIQVPEGHAYLCGDNMTWSRDSRNYGPVPLGLINGKITARVWPLQKRKWIENSLQPARLTDDKPPHN